MDLGLPQITTGQAMDALGTVMGPGLAPEVMMATFFVVLARMIGFIVVAPFFGSMNIPMTARVSLAVVLTTVITPMVAADAQMGLIENGPPGGFDFLMLLVNQLFIGLMFGFVAAFIFYGVESAGRVIDTQRGSNITDIIAPQTGDRTSPVGQWLMMFALMVLLTSNQHLLILDAMIDTFRLFPASGSLDWIGDPLRGGSLQHMSPVLKEFVALSGQSLEITIKIAAPAMLSLMLTDILLGIINRGAPQVNVFALSQVVKGPIGIGGVLVALGSIALFLENGALTSIWKGNHSIGNLAELMGKASGAG